MLTWPSGLQVGREQFGKQAGWKPRSGCSCSGYENKHGFGGSCHGWEYEGQTPWCYTTPNCSFVEKLGLPRRGSFGQPYVHCEPWYERLTPSTSPSDSSSHAVALALTLPSSQ